MHPSSSEYSMPKRRVVNKFLDDPNRILVELFDRKNCLFEPGLGFA